MKTLETDRLILRPFVLEDLDDFYEYCSLKTVGPNAGWAVHENKEHSKKIIMNFIEKQDVLALSLKENRKVIGSVGLHKKMAEDNKEYYEIGYVLSTPYEGRGLMTEAVKRVVKHAFLDLGIEMLYVCHFLENHKSRRVVEKCHFEYLYDIQYETINFGTKESRLYHLKKEQYLKMEGIQ